MGVAGPSARKRLILLASTRGVTQSGDGERFPARQSGASCRWSLELQSLVSAYATNLSGDNLPGAVNWSRGYTVKWFVTQKSR
jgi:hypothetical protein